MCVYTKNRGFAMCSDTVTALCTHTVAWFDPDLTLLKPLDSRTLLFFQSIKSFDFFSQTKVPTWGALQTALATSLWVTCLHGWGAGEEDEHIPEEIVGRPKKLLFHWPVQQRQQAAAANNIGGRRVQGDKNTRQWCLETAKMREYARQRLSLGQVASSQPTKDWGRQRTSCIMLTLSGQ